MAPYLLRVSEFVVLMYDITSRESLDYITAGIKDIRLVKGKAFKNVILLGNKCDADDSRQVKFPVVQVIP